MEVKDILRKQRESRAEIKALMAPDLSVPDRPGAAGTSDKILEFEGLNEFA